jgi:hypothetical protein
LDLWGTPDYTLPDSQVCVGAVDVAASSPLTLKHCAAVASTDVPRLA